MVVFRQVSVIENLISLVLLAGDKVAKQQTHIEQISHIRHVYEAVRASIDLGALL